MTALDVGRGSRSAPRGRGRASALPSGASAGAEATSSTSMSRRLFIGNLHPDVSSADLRQRFGNFGDVQDVDVRNKNDATFAFVDISFSDQEHGLRKCIDLLNNTKWKGLTMKVQPAKENFIEKLKKERELSRNVRRPKPPDNFDFEIVSSTAAPDKNADESGNRKLNGTRTSDPAAAAKLDKKQELAPVPVRTGLRSASKSVVAAALRSVSNKSVATAAAPCLKEQLSSASSDSDSSSNDSAEEDTRKTRKPQLPMFRGILSYPSLQEPKPEPADIQPMTITANFSSSAFTNIPTAAPVSTGQGLKTNPLKKQKSDELRLQSLQTRVDLKKSREAIIRHALSNASLAEQQNNEARPQQQTSSAPQSQSKTKEAGTDFLFGASDGEDGDETKDQFKIKPQYEGEAGQRLMELRSKFGGDDRFQLDERFTEEDSAGVTKAAGGQGQGDDEADEKQTQMNVLSEMFGPGILAGPKHAGHSSSHAQASVQIEPSSLGLVRYHPSSAEHKRKYEIKVEDAKTKATGPAAPGTTTATRAALTATAVNLSLSKAKRDKKGKETETQIASGEPVAATATPAEMPKPVYKVAPNLKDLFSDGKDVGGERGEAPAFSLLSSFASTSNADFADAEENSDSEVKSTPKSGQATSSKNQATFWNNAKPNPFKYDSSDDEGGGGGRKKKSSPSEPERPDLTSHLNLFKGESFFYTEDDPRLAGVFESFMKSDEDLEAVKTKFNDGGRSELKTIARAKWKNSKRKNEKRIKAIKLARKKKRRDAVKKLQHHEKIRAIRESRANQD